MGKPLIEFTRTDLISLLGNPGWIPKTKQTKRSMFHTFFSLLVDEGYRPDNPSLRLPKGKPPRIEANPVSTDELQQLLSLRLFRRTRMMVLLMAYHGFRCVEVAATSGANIDWAGDRI